MEEQNKNKENNTKERTALEANPAKSVQSSRLPTKLEFTLDDDNNKTEKK